MAVNVPLLRKTLEHIETHPEEWDQGKWRCETGMCFAGTAADLMGAQWVGDDEYLVADDQDDDDHVICDVDRGRITYAAYRAKRELGLTEDQSERLFAGGNTLDDLRRIVAELSEDGVS